MRLWDSVNNVLKRLDDYPADNQERVWSRDEVELYLEDGYNAFCRKTRCLFDMFYPENIPLPGNYVAKWEETYFDSSQIAIGLLNYSGGYWERDYAQAGAIGPGNSTQPWEATYLGTSYLNISHAVSLHPVPEDNVTVERATHNWHQLAPEWTRFFEENDRDFQTTTGDPWRFSMDRDGISSMRIVPAGSGDAAQVETSGTYGLLRDAGDTDGLGTWSPVGSWGVLREIPEHFTMGGQYGIPRRLYSDTDNTRVEYVRLGKDLDEYEYEIPERFIKYVEYYAQARCLERDGPGQDLKLAAHFDSRFADGVNRMVLRMGEVKRPMKGVVGGAGRTPTKPALARLPWRYGRATRRGY